ncbi:unnamed protein product [Macrosiphum euphorbiae]|uniref:Uncharacterized protein n=1 Tax=Macrosiphum euphorbiae TaxID=13131 RepID=A0AAV0W5Z6_9HEMI|nr:unnamed protein product [Macrosiphum euphorbiae]
MSSWLARGKSRLMKAEHEAKGRTQKGLIRWTHDVDENRDDSSKSGAGQSVKMVVGAGWNLWVQIRGLKRFSHPKQ